MSSALTIRTHDVPPLSTCVHRHSKRLPSIGSMCGFGRAGV